MPRAQTKRSLFLFLLLCAPRPAAPQTLALQQLNQRAGIVFAGTVTHIQPGAHQVRITFRVDQGFRGVAGKRMLTIREWAGLWTFAPRYRVGERLVLFLYPPASTGLTSPVGGPMGRFAIDDRNRIVIPPAREKPGSSPPPRSRPTVTSDNPNPRAVPHPSVQTPKAVPHPSASAESAPRRLTLKQFTELMRRAQE